MINHDISPVKVRNLKNKSLEPLQTKVQFK
jgi:hypothetical protein